MARPPRCFVLMVGMRTVISSEERRRDLEWRIDQDKFSQVLRGSANDDLATKTSYCVFNILSSMGS